MTRRIAAVMVGWALVAATVGLLFAGDQVAGCLGPLGVTPAQCRAMLGLPPETAWGMFLQSFGPVLALVLGGCAVIWLVARTLRSRPSPSPASGPAAGDAGRPD